MGDFSGKEVNSVLKHVLSLAPGVDAKSGERQLSILAVALCTAARDCGVERENFLFYLEKTFDDVAARELQPLFGSN